MEFIGISIAALLALAVIAAVASMVTKGGTDTPVTEVHDCSSCSSMVAGECKIACLIEEKKRREGNKSAD